MKITIGGGNTAFVQRGIRQILTAAIVIAVVFLVSGLLVTGAVVAGAFLACLLLGYLVVAVIWGSRFRVVRRASSRVSFGVLGVRTAIDERDIAGFYRFDMDWLLVRLISARPWPMLPVPGISDADLKALSRLCAGVPTGLARFELVTASPPLVPGEHVVACELGRRCILPTDPTAEHKADEDLAVRLTNHE